ncbi:MAG: hypothetical protein K0R90_490 [Oscillospiraceae bacterium]|jgi:AraC-like DNA-binding protein|nr:hypothetical protein [Oscillospiraceae bacterium]
MCRIFKQCTGTTIVEYVNQLRCKKAISLINDGETISQAAALVGYNDYNYFSRTFKKIYGMSPTSLIKQTSKDRHEESAEI